MVARSPRFGGGADAVTALIFLLLAMAMIVAWVGQRAVGCALFAVAMILAVVWFNHHMTDPLGLDF